MAGSAGSGSKGGEGKPTEGATTYDNTKGISLITASARRNSPSTVDSKIHHNNMINNILPKIEANLAHAADALMLDLDGFVSETNATNVFMVDDSVLITPHADHCLPGITRETVINLAAELGIPCEVRRVSLAEFHAADEVFTTGTMGELTPVTKVSDIQVISFMCEATTFSAYKEICHIPSFGLPSPRLMAGPSARDNEGPLLQGCKRLTRPCRIARGGPLNSQPLQVVETCLPCVSI